MKPSVEFALRDTPWGLLPKSMVRTVAKVPEHLRRVFKEIAMGQTIPAANSCYEAAEELEKLGFVKSAGQYGKWVLA